MATEGLDVLRSASDYRAFLSLYLRWKNMSQASLARAAGVGRGFPSDLITGRRPLTLKTFLSLERCMKLPPTPKRFFKLLVALENQDVAQTLGQTPAVVREEVERLRSRPWKNNAAKTFPRASASRQTLLGSVRVLKVLAAAGSPDAGASRDELSLRSGLAEAELTEYLTAMISEGLLQEENGRFFPRDFHVFFDGKELRAAFLAQFSAACRGTAERADRHLNESSELYWTSYFCVKKDKLPAYKQALKQTLLQFVDDAIETEGGDAVVQLLVALHQ